LGAALTEQWNTEDLKNLQVASGTRWGPPSGTLVKRLILLMLAYAEVVHMSKSIGPD
jgi:hypothetical protein